MAETTSENVNHPSHYNVGKIEVIDAIEDWGLNFSLGNAVKYIARADHKDKPVEDLEKARWYIEREIERRKQNDSDVMLFKFNGDKCYLVRDGNKFTLDECGYIICDVCEHYGNDTVQYPCDVCCHGGGNLEYFKLNKREVEVIK